MICIISFFINNRVVVPDIMEARNMVTAREMVHDGNWRQEAIGNIIVALYLGAKVFLSHVNPVYEWAQSHGLTVYELEKLSQKELDTPLDRETKLKNRQILLSLYTKERMYRLIKDLSV